MNYRKILLSAILAFALSAQAQKDNDALYSEPGISKPTPHTISFDVGPAWITSKMYTPSGTYSWRGGFELGVEYSCVFSRGYGFGISYLQNSTSYPEGKARVNFMGPSFVYAGFLSRKWRGIAEIGMGYSSFYNGYSTESGFGVKYSTGMEYMLSDNIGISAKLRSLTVYIGGKNEDYGDSDERNGVARLAFQLGVNFHF